MMEGFFVCGESYFMLCVAWMTDIHLNFLLPAQLGEFMKMLATIEADRFIISGDIAEAREVSEHLETMAATLRKPIDFVLGNHDFYRGSISGVREVMQILCEELPLLNYLTQADVVELTPTVGMVGHDGWADLQHGDFKRSSVWMNDYVLIRELMNTNKRTLPPKVRVLAKKAAEHTARTLMLALEKYPQVYVVTHVPPFVEACWHNGQISDDEWLPHFTCKAVGDVLLALAMTYPQRQITVLCGHTHGKGTAQIRDNLKVLTGGAEYGQPTIQNIFELE